MSFLLVAYLWYSHAQKCGAYGTLHELMIYFEICSLCFVCLFCLLCLPNVCWHQMQGSVARPYSGECYSCNRKAATSPWTDCFCLSMGKIVCLLCERACLATFIRQISAMSHANAVILSWQCLCLCRCDSVSVMTCCCHADQTLCSPWLYNLLCLEKLPVSKETWRRWSWRCSFTGNHTLGVPNLTTWDLTCPFLHVTLQRQQQEETVTSGRGLLCMKINQTIGNRVWQPRRSEINQNWARPKNGSQNSIESLWRSSKE